MSENDPYGSEGGALHERPYPYYLQKNSLIVFERGHKAHGYVHSW